MSKKPDITPKGLEMMLGQIQTLTQSIKTDLAEIETLVEAGRPAKKPRLGSPAGPSPALPPVPASSTASTLTPVSSAESSTASSVATSSAPAADASAAPAAATDGAQTSTPTLMPPPAPIISAKPDLSYVPAPVPTAVHPMCGCSPFDNIALN